MVAIAGSGIILQRSKFVWRRNVQRRLNWGLIAAFAANAACWAIAAGAANFLRL